jgi:Zn-dependent M28 family amino/carboxypeptidase
VPVPDPLRARGAIDAGQLQSASQVPERTRRTERLTQLFKQAGCGSEFLEVTEHGGTPYPNVICTLPGKTNYTIVVGANVDKPPDGKGVIDNWTGAALLPHLYRSLAAAPRQHSFLFIGFGHVLKDEQGSRGYLRRLGAEKRDRIRAMVNLKGLGLGATSIWSTQADRNLRQDLHSVAKAIGLPLESVRFFRNVNADSEAFLFWGIPSITITSYSKTNAHLLENPVRDREVSQIDLTAYYDSARLLALHCLPR